MVLRRFIYFVALVFFFTLLVRSADAAVLYMAPSSNTTTTSSSFNVTVSVDTQGVAINAAEATISFPANLLEVTSVSKAGTFTLWTSEPSYSNANGTVSFGGGVPNPGYNGSTGGIITIHFRSEAEGTASVSITSGSVLANDGQGTNVLSGRRGGTYTIQPGLDLPAAPTVSSPTHPEQALWYALNSPTFTWTTEGDVTGYSFSFDDQEGASPDTVGDGTDSRESYSGIGDGVWYFHVRARNDDGWGGTGHFAVHIDTTPPREFNIFALISEDADVDRQISFETTDDLSGVHHYDIVIDGGVPIPINVGETSPYTLPELGDGRHDIVASAYDFAGNKRSASATLTIGTATPVNETPPEAEPPSKPLADRLLDIVKKTEEQVRAILPKPINDAIDAFGRTVRDLRNNNAIQEIIDEILEPVSTSALILATVGVAATSTVLEITNLLYLLFRFGYFWLIPISLGKRRRPWGVVFDSTTGRPVKGAIVRIFSKEFNKLRESQITDEQGRFGFLVEIGEYYLTIARPGFMFPSRLLTTSVISRYEHIYRGESFVVKERIEGAITINVPVDPEDMAVSKVRMAWIKALNVMGVILEKMNTPLLVGGTVMSWVMLVLRPSLGNYFILAVYGMLILLKFLHTKHVQRSWGDVRDGSTNTPVELAVVRVYNMASGAIMCTRITNREGKFTALVPPGQYYLMVLKVGYDPFQSQPILVSKQQGLIQLTVLLHQLRRPTPQSPGGTFTPPTKPLSPMGSRPG